MLEQNELFRSMAFGRFHELFLAVTTNPAMLLFLNGTSNNKWDPNENYAREMMELFSLGADRGAYTEDDVREMARALTGWRNDWSEALGNYNFRFDPSYHDTGKKTVFGQTGKWNYEDAVRLCVSHPLHASFFVTKLWGYFIPRRALRSHARVAAGASTPAPDYSIRAVVEAILQHPDFYEGPELVTPPVVYNAGLLRSISRPIDTTAWAWLSANAGQQLFYPPNVSGWDFTRWLDTSTAKARWEIASYVDRQDLSRTRGRGRANRCTARPRARRQRSQARIAYWAEPGPVPGIDSGASPPSRESCLKEPLATWERSPYRAMRQNALRMLIATSPGHAGQLSVQRRDATPREEPADDGQKLLVQRLHPLAAAAARRGDRRQGTAVGSSRGCRLPAGTGMDRRTFLLAHGGRAAVRLRRLDAQPAPLRRGHRPGRGAAAPNAAGARVDLHGRRMGRAVGARPRQGTHVQRTPPDAGSRRKATGSVFTEDETLMWHPAATGLAELHEEGKVSVFPAIGYEPADESHFTSRHYWEVGQLDANARSGWMGRYLDLVGEPAQPPAGPVPGLLAGARRWRPRRCPSPRSPRRPTTRCGPTASANR